MQLAMRESPRLRDLGAVLNRHPHIPMAFKAAAAAALSWLVVLSLGGIADEYPYYAPLGAVIAVSATVASSVKASLQSLLAIVCGAALAATAAQTPLPEVVALALVVAVGTLLGTLRLFGTMRSWVPISALFVLIIGGESDLTQYAIAYVGLTSLGAVIGIALNLAFPPLPLTPTERAVSALRDTIAGQLDDLADGLRQEEPLTREEWLARQREIGPRAAEMRQMVAEATEARRVNWRARRWQDVADRQYEHSRALERLSLAVEDITMLVIDNEHADREHPALGPTLRGPAAQALEDTAYVLRDTTGSTAEEECLRVADRAATELGDEIRRMFQYTDGELFKAGAIVAAVRQVIASLTPAELADSLPSG